MSFGAPSQFQPQSLVSTLVVEPVLGLDVSRSPLNIADGATPNSENWIMRDGRLELRSVLSRLADDAAGASSVLSMAGVLTGGIAANAVDDSRYVVVGGRGSVGFSSWAWLGPGAVTWQNAFLAGGAFQPASGDYWDMTQIYSDVDDQNVVVGAMTSRGTSLLKWVVGATNVPVISGAPQARYVAAFNDYLLAANINDGSNIAPQRVQWSDRGSASSWTGGVSGFQDLLSARGGITRILPLERRIIVFFEDEIWEGTPIDFPFTFNFQPLDSTIGCPFSWTAAVTPRGIVFMARNFQMYLLPKEGGAAQPIGAPLHRRIRDSIVQPAKAFGAYDGVNDQYHFYYSSGASANFANRAAFLNFAGGSWAPQSFDTQRLVLTRAFTAPLGTSHASTWDDFLTFQPTVTWNDINESWDDLLGIGNERQTVIALSATTVFEYSSTMSQDSQESSGGSTAGLPRTAFYEGKAFGADAPAVEKTLTQVSVEYVAPSASSLTVRTSPSQGAAYGVGIGLSLRTASAVSSEPAYVLQPARYPMFRVEASTQTGIELHRFHVTARIGGR